MKEVSAFTARAKRSSVKVGGLNAKHVHCVDSSLPCSSMPPEVLYTAHSGCCVPYHYLNGSQRFPTLVQLEDCPLEVACRPRHNSIPDNFGGVCPLNMGLKFFPGM